MINAVFAQTGTMTLFYHAGTQFIINASMIGLIRGSIRVQSVKPKCNGAMWQLYDADDEQNMNMN